MDHQTMIRQLMAKYSVDYQTACKLLSDKLKREATNTWLDRERLSRFNNRINMYAKAMQFA